jgi:carbamoyltransferase
VASFLATGGVELDEVDQVVFYDKPLLKFERLIETYQAFAPKGLSAFRTALPIWLREKLFQERLLRDELRRFAPGFKPAGKLVFAEHHQSHAASAFFPSPFDEAVILTMDGVGEWATTTVGFGRGNQIEIVREIHFPHSLGLLYSAFTYYLGFKVNDGEYKVMGLAPYGEPKYAQLILDHLIDLKPDGTFRVDQSYFDYCTGLRMTNDRFDKLGGKPRRSEDPISQREMDIAASVQAVTEEVVLRLTRALAAETGMANLCLAGGVALNCVANGKVLREGKFKRIWIQPAAGDAGGALGAALAAYHIHSGRPRRIDNRLDGMSGAYLGPAYDADSIRASLDSHRAHYQELDADALDEEVAAAIDQEKVVGWFQGRMEFGPRALGNRSILAKATSPKMQSVLNLKIKYRESFRPFAPAVLRDDLAEWFEMDVDSPYMLLVADVAERRRRKLTAAEEALFGIAKLNVPRSDIPAVTHVDYSARSRRCTPTPIRAFTGCWRRSRRAPAPAWSSTPASMCATSRSSARPTTPMAASWRRRWTCWRSAISSCANRSSVRTSLRQPAPRARCSRPSFWRASSRPAARESRWSGSKELSAVRKQAPCFLT